MTTILEIFGIIELVMIVSGIVLMIILQEIAKLMGLMVLVYGTATTVLGLLITTIIHDHVHIMLR